jgi:GDPmannose 4,6-dehydratase
MAKLFSLPGSPDRNSAYIAELLLGKDMSSAASSVGRRRSIRRASITSAHIPDGHLQGHYGDMTDSANLIRIIQAVQPDELYNLSAQSHLQISLSVAPHMLKPYHK